jgi:hypothetical protein
MRDCGPERNSHRGAIVAERQLVDSPSARAQLCNRSSCEVADTAVTGADD